jgi:hypothetical protein
VSPPACQLHAMAHAYQLNRMETALATNQLPNEVVVRVSH